MPSTRNVQKIAPACQMLDMTGSWRSKVSADNQDFVIHVPCQQRFPGLLSLGLIHVSGGTPVRPAHLHRVMNAVAGNQRLGATGADVHAHMPGGMTRRGFETNLLAHPMRHIHQID